MVCTPSEKNHNMIFNPKAAWESVKILTGGTTSHHPKPNIMQIFLPTGNISTTDKENAEVLGPHFEKVFNKHRPIKWKLIDKIKQHQTMYELNDPITWAEIKTVIAKLANDKAPGLNKVPPNAFKSLSNKNHTHLLTFFNQYWKVEADFAEWHKGQLVPAPKSGDLFNPNKWHRVTLMDIGSKVFSSILCARLFKVIKKHGVKYQFGSTPGVGCQDSIFTIKTLLHLRHNHNLPTWVALSGLVNALDTSNHQLMVMILAKCGCPQNLCNTVARMYKDSVVK